MKQAIPHSQSRRAFTLTEMLVAIALLLVIMISVATIFRNASQAVSVGIAVTAQNRAMADAAQQLRQDFVGYLDTNPFASTAGMFSANATTGAPPFMYILNYQQSAYRDPAAASAGTTTNYRLDSFGFFANGAFKRQTGSNGQLIDEMPVFNRAFISYGHLWLPDNSGKYVNSPNPPTLPGAGTPATNPNNYYAIQWTLGRRALLLADVAPAAATNAGTVSNGVTFYGRLWNSTASGGTFSTYVPSSQWDPQNFAPLGTDSTNYSSACPSLALSNDTTPVAPNWAMCDSRFDLVGMNREQSWSVYADLVQNYQDQWGSTPQPNAFHIPWPLRYFSTRSWASLTQSLDIDWASSAQTVAQKQQAFASSTALSIPVLLRNCTSFTVEFAGDYVSQKDDGSLTAAHPVFDVNNPQTWLMDGVIDFDVVNGVRQIHWYGLPHDRVTTVSQMRSGNANPSQTYVPFEQWDNTDFPGVLAFGWSKTMLALPDTSNPPVKQSLAPQLIRITVQVSDPQGRVLEDMTRQYIFPVKHDW